MCRSHARLLYSCAGSAEASMSVRETQHQRLRNRPKRETRCRCQRASHADRHFCCSGVAFVMYGSRGETHHVAIDARSLVKVGAGRHLRQPSAIVIIGEGKDLTCTVIDNAYSLTVDLQCYTCTSRYKITRTVHCQVKRCVLVFFVRFGRVFDRFTGGGGVGGRWGGGGRGD